MRTLSTVTATAKASAKHSLFLNKNRCMTNPRLQLLCGGYVCVLWDIRTYKRSYGIMVVLWDILMVW